MEVSTGSFLTQETWNIWDQFGEVKYDLASNTSVVHAFGLWDSISFVLCVWFYGYEVLKIMKLTIDIDGFREEIDPTSSVGIIKNQLNYLRHLKNDGRVPSSHLLKDISTYEYILKSQNPEEVADNYFKTKHEMKAEKDIVLNYEVAEKLGWGI